MDNAGTSFGKIDLGGGGATLESGDNGSKYAYRLGTSGFFQSRTPSDLIMGQAYFNGSNFIAGVNGAAMLMRYVSGGIIIQNYTGATAGSSTSVGSLHSFNGDSSLTINSNVHPALAKLEVFGNAALVPQIGAFFNTAIGSTISVNSGHTVQITPVGSANGYQMYNGYLPNQPSADSFMTTQNTGNYAALGRKPLSALSILEASANLTVQTTAGTVTTFAVPGSGSFNTFRVGGYLNVTAVTTDVITLQVVYTDENSVSQTQSFFVQGAVTGIGAISSNGYSPIDIRVKQGTTITMQTALTTSGGSITFDVGSTIMQIN
jgi:hypothetical protein